jgi:eukaryotic-like serine/threonine-protein kinase
MSTVHRPRIVADRYRLVQQLGQGGMGRVWLAHDDLLHRDVAIKEIVPPSGLTAAERQEMRERTLREARAIARLSHPNVVRIFDVLGRDGDPWIVMEYVRGRSLQEVLATDGPLPVARVVDIGLGVLAALRAAHRAGMLHRDVKPGNVLLGEDGRVVLTDFGLATVPGDPVVTRTGLVLGSPAYLAPERARDGSAGPEADLWSLGATLFAAVEGQSPYARPSAIATLAALATEPPAPAKQAGPLRPLLNGLLRKKPAERISPAEAERLLLRAAGPRSRTELGRAPLRGVRLRRPPGPDTFAAAAGAAIAAAKRKNAAVPGRVAEATKHPESKTPDAQPAAATQTDAPAAEARTPDVQAAAAETDAPAAEARTPDVENRAPEADAAEVKTRDVESRPVESPHAEAPRVEVPPTEIAQETPEVRQDKRFAPVPSSMDDRRRIPLADTVVPIVPGPRAPAQPAMGVAAVPEPPLAGQHGRQRVWWWAAAAVGLVLVLVVAIAALAANRKPEGERGNTSGGPSTGAGGAGAAAASAAPASSAATKTPAGSPTPAVNGGDPVLPQGWRFHRDRTGFRVAVPAGWTVSRRSTMVYFREPGGGRVLGIDQSDRPKRDPVADWKRQEANRVAAGDWDNYHRVRIEPVNYFVKAADWEFTYTASGGRTHVINRGFITSPSQAYAIYWSTPESQWSENLANFRLIAQSFRPRT